MEGEVGRLIFLLFQVFFIMSQGWNENKEKERTLPDRKTTFISPNSHFLTSNPKKFTPFKYRRLPLHLSSEKQDSKTGCGIFDREIQIDV